MVLAAGCTGSDSGRSSASGSSSSSGATSSPGSSSSTSSTAAGAGLAQVPQIADALEPSVVTVLVAGGNGSGVVYTADGKILTNEHVVRGTSSVQVAFADGQRVPGTVTATDPVTDLALVQADRRGLPAAKFQTRLPEVGGLAVVIGSPLGFQNTVTAGVISGLHRDIPGSAAQSQSLVDLIQTDAPISPGNSSGALIGASGQVVGISEAYIPPQAGAVNIGFAIPAATAVDIADQLNRTGHAEHAFAGLVPAPITPQIAQQLGLQSTQGVIVADLAPGGPADQAGLVPGDVITAVDGQTTANPEDFLATLRKHRPGDPLTITAHRPGQAPRQLRLTVTDRPPASQ